MNTNKELKKSALFLKDYCQKHCNSYLIQHACDCIFYEEGKNCPLGTPPRFWDLPPIHVWSEKELDLIRGSMNFETEYIERQNDLLICYDLTGNKVGSFKKPYFFNLDHEEVIKVSDILSKASF